MTKAVILARVSTTKQEKEGLSLKEIHFTLGILGTCYLICSRPNWYGVPRIPSGSIHTWGLPVRIQAKVQPEPPE